MSFLNYCLNNDVERLYNTLRVCLEESEDLKLLKTNRDFIINTIKSRKLSNNEILFYYLSKYQIKINLLSIHNK